MAEEIKQEEQKVFEALREASGPLPYSEIVDKTGLDQSKVSALLLHWGSREWVKTEEKSRTEFTLADEFKAAPEKKLPERLFLDALGDRDACPMQECSKMAGKLGVPFGDVIKWGKKKDWFATEKGNLTVTEIGKGMRTSKEVDEELIELLRSKDLLFDDELASSGIDTGRLESCVRNRTSFIKVKERKFRYAELTDKGREELSGAEIVKEKTILSSEEITSGEWATVKLREFDVTIPADRIHPAKIHPLRKILEETRRVFLEMGFTEIASPQVDSTFWVFDALFQPQDHPARDMQDTFYLDRPGKTKLPPDDLVEKIKRTHEDGWETGSKGWGYKWERERARSAVLRTHTTASTIRALAERPEPPGKVFCVGKNFRNESISYKHLPEFHQVDGIIIDEGSDFASLLGTLREFYRKMGFEKVRFKPAFFPYTEPSAEVYVMLPGKGEWIELGGSGVFRPEVTEPFGCPVPVLAWGLGLERLAMVRYGIEDIRQFYLSDLDWLRGVPLCR